MKTLALALLALIALPSVALADGWGVQIGNLTIICCGGNGTIHSIADEREKYEKKRNRIGGSLVILGNVRLAPVVPLPRRQRL